MASPTRGEATSFQQGLYQVDGLTYPDDLLAPYNNQYGNNYVIFYVNVHEDSVLYKDKGEAFVPADAVLPSMRGEVAGMNVSTATMEAIGFGAGAITANAAGVTQKAVGALGATPNSSVATAANTAIGGLTGAAAVAAVGGASKKYKRMQKAIALYVPTDLSIKYGVNWEETNLAGTSAIAAAEGLGDALKKTTMGGAAGAAVGALLGGKKGALIGAGLGAGAGAIAGGGDLMKAGGSLANYGAGLALQTPGAGEFLSKTSGVAANPKKEQLFKNVDFRTFSFSYQFFPRSSDEARKVQEIIKAFKLHMHPEFKGTGNFLYIYPSEFDIYYYQNGVENMNLHRHTSCVLTDMNVSYSPQGIFSTFEDGMPTQINIQLTFKELALLTKESIMDGY